MKISKTTIVLAGITAFTILAVWTITTEKRTPAATPAAAGFETREQSGGNVTVIVTPQELGTGKPAVFQIVFDTHSVDLNFDVAGQAQLRDEKGTLSFPTPLTKTISTTLTLKNIAGVAQRAFTWNL